MAPKFQNLFSNLGVLSLKNSRRSSRFFDNPANLVVLICVSILLIGSILWVKRRRRKRPQTEKSEQPSSKEDLHPTAFAHLHLKIMQMIAAKISHEKEHLKEAALQDAAAFHGRTFDRLSTSQLSLQASLQDLLSRRRRHQERRFCEVERALKSFKRKLAAVRGDLEADALDQDPQQAEADKQAERRTAETQTDEGAEDWQMEEVENEESLVKAILSSTRENFEKLVLEAKLRGREILGRISDLLDRSGRDIQREADIFKAVAARTTTGGGPLQLEEAGGALVAQVDRLESHLHETFRLLNRQRFETEGLNEALRHFQRRFGQAADRLEAAWRQAEAASQAAAARLARSRSLSSAAGKRLDVGGQCLLQKTKVLRAVASDVRRVLAAKQVVVVATPGREGLWKETGRELVSEVSVCGNEQGLWKDADGGRGSATSVAPSWPKEIGDADTKMEDVMEVVSNVRRKMAVLAQATQTLEGLRALVESVADAYCGLTSALNSGGGKRPHTDRSKTSERDPNAEESGEKRRKKSNVTLNSGPANMDTGKIAFILNDIFKTSMGGVSGRLRQKADQQKTQKWDKMSTDSLLADVSSSCLIQDSDESTD